MRSAAFSVVSVLLELATPVAGQPRTLPGIEPANIRWSKFQSSKDSCRHGYTGAIVVLGKDVKDASSKTHVNAPERGAAYATQWAAAYSGSFKPLTLIAGVVVNATDDVLERLVADNWKVISRLQANCALESTALPQKAGPPLGLTMPFDPDGRQGEAPWGLDRLDSRSALDGVYAYGEDSGNETVWAAGASTRVYVLSTGIRIGHVWRCQGSQARSRSGARL